MSLLMAETNEGAPPVPASPFPGWPASHSWTLDDLDRLPEDGRRYEIIDGSLYVSPCPSVAHQFWVQWLNLALLENMPDGCFVLPGNVNVLLPAEPARLVVPDVLAGCGIDAKAKGKPLYLEPANLRVVVEVVSPGSTTHDRYTKPVLYAEAGIPTYWRVEDGADGPSVHVYQHPSHRFASGPGPRITGPDEGRGSAKYTQACVIRPGDTVTLDRPWPVTLTPPVEH